MAYKRILTIQDISCLGQCSMTVALPIMSACGHEVCILPSALLSTHTGGFDKPAVTDLTSSLEGIWQHWRREKITFDAIYTGYLGSIESINIANQIMDELLAPGGVVIVDPAMADHGKLYRGFDEAYADAMKTLCMRADIMIPNVTEAAMFAGVPYRENFDEVYIYDILQKLGGNDIVLTGVGFEPDKTGVAIRSEKKCSYYFHERIARSYHGTGDMFAAAFTGALMRGRSVYNSVHIASEFTCQCIRNTFESPAHWYGVKFETALPLLIKMLGE